MPKSTAQQSPNPYILSHLDVYNWGPFAERHRAEIDERGTAIIGPTGSGKTTLVDAFMTLLVAQPKYNLASTGGHESDRDLVSYVRGVAGAGNASGDNEHIARPGKTLTAIALSFKRFNLLATEPDQLQIAAIFALDGTSSAVSDLKRVWLCSTALNQDIDDWLALYHDEGPRALKQLGRTEPGIQIFDSKKAYLAQVRRFFDVGENAFTLLNRAAGLKQLNSIDDIFRELVLDDHSAFSRAAEVAAEFDDLSAIHAELQTARRQQQSLLPIEKGYQAYQKSAQRQQSIQQLQHYLPIWYAEHAHQGWLERGQHVRNDLEQSQQIGKQLTTQLEQSESQLQTLRDQYLQAGGANIEQLKQLIRTQTGVVADRRRNAEDYQRIARKLGLPDAIEQTSLLNNQKQLGSKAADNKAALDKAQQMAWEQGAKRQQQQQTLQELRQALMAAKARPSSNIPELYQNFKTELAQAINLAEEDLPYVAELMQIKPEQAHWRGAIERAIGGHRLRLLVPPEQIKAALRWINQRHNRLHVRLLEANPPSKPSEFMSDGFTRKLDFKPHAHREALKKLLADIDRHCVDSVEALHQTTHAMTEQGLMSSKSGFFDKQDQKRLDQDWWTGFDNKDRLNQLGQQIQTGEQALNEAEQAFQQAEQNYQQLNHQQQLSQQLLALNFAQIDLPGAQQILQSHEQHLKQLQAPDSDLQRVQQRWQTADAEHKALQRQTQDNQTEQKLLEKDLSAAQQQQKRAFERIGSGLDDAQREQANAAFTQPDSTQLDEFPDLERQANDELLKQLKRVNTEVANNERQLSVLMVKAQKLDTGALSEAGSELQDVPVYLERLKTLTEEALPQKLQRFLDYLNQSSDQGVTQLLSNIDNQVAVIQERIEDLNQTMLRVDFQPGRYLQLEPRRVEHESLRTLQKAQRHLRTAALEADEGESHYKALTHMVALLRDASERKKTVGARALLDPRYRLQFSVSVVERDTGRVIETRTGSQGGSGGEKEIIASYILTASLSYALCPNGASAPLFGTIVLDEAFSKSSQAVAGRIISALREFGLHPLFITPNKEMRLLRAHTRSAVLIHRRGLRATMTSLSWEELEEKARQQLKM